jgi:putative transposase
MIEKFQPLDYNKLLNDYFITHSKHLKPVKHRSKSVPDSIYCPRCNAPHTYIYDNNGGKGQFLCKFCKTTFSPDKKFKSVVFKCPLCGKTLEKVKGRKNFDVYKCKNDSCSFYINNLNSLSDSEREDFKSNSQKFKLKIHLQSF